MLGTLFAVMVQLTNHTNFFHNRTDAYRNHTFKFGLVGIMTCVSCIIVIGYVYNFAQK